MTTMYGIKNCDTIKKARKWLSTNDVEYTFHDYRADGIDAKWLEEIEAIVGWETLLNKRGTTFRQLSDAQKENLNTQTALALMLEAPAMIKRPLLIHNDQHIVGFKDAQYQEIFK
ncbi:ArsC family reductase [Paraglaciecola chathamensis]|uniref:ArsC family reductase n=1 Tax=Paraglaciecola chathamensis TaxID=368405 RepID=A0ABS0WFA4_9ALTE|nr:ArsC family reductase [Paraglaciecola chathamensis]MBJ2137155.1 ArsC family reductase [Paraglaciecola chathamensis]